MSQSETPAAPQPEKETKPQARRRRRWPWILLGALVLLFLLVALAPTLLSTGPMRRLVLGKVSSRLNGTVTAESWSLGWFSGIRMSDLKVADAAHKEIVSVSSITVPAGLLSLARSDKKLGNVEVVGPVVDVVVDADGTTNLQKLMKPEVAAGPGAGEKPAGASKEGSASAPRPLGMDLHGNLKVSDGHITVRAAGSEQAFEVKALNVAVAIDGLNNPVKFDAAALLGEANAPLKVQGSAKVMENGVVNPQALEADMTADLDKLQLKEFQPIAAQFHILDRLSGAVSAHVQAKAKGTADIQSEGRVNVDTLALGGGLLGKDEPAFDHISLNFDVARQSQSVVIRTFKLDSPVVTAESSGSMSLPAPGQLPAGDLKSRAEVNLPELARRFPDTLRLQEGLTLTGGALKSESVLSSKEGVTRATSAISITGLTAQRAGREIALDKPITFAAELSQSARGVNVDKFELSSSFAKASGAGNADKFDLTLTSDIAAALAEARKFVDMGKFNAAGSLLVEAHVAAAAPQRRAINAVAQVTDLLISTGDAQPQRGLPKVALTFEAQAVTDGRDAPQSLEGVKIAGDSALAQFSAKSDKLTLLSGKPLPVSGKLAIDGAAELSRLMAVAHAMNMAPAAVDVSGQAAFNGELLLDQEKATFFPAKLAVTDLVVTQGTKKIAEPKVELTFAASAAPAARALKLSDMKLSLSSGQVTGSANVPDWAAPQSATAAFQGQFDVAKLLASLRDFAPLPAGTTVAATASFDLKVAAGRESQKADLSAQLADLKVSSPGKPEVTEKKVELAASALFTPATPGAVGGSSLSLESLKVASELLALQARARIDDLEKTRKLQADGTWTPNFDRIGPLASAFSGQQIELSGNEPREFHVKAELGSADLSALLRGLATQGGVYVKRVSAMGIETGVMDVPLRFENGQGAMKIDTTVNGGKLLLPLQVDARGKVAVATLPDNTPALAGAKITDAMADQFLSRVSPLFKGGVVSAGTVGLTLKKMNVPLASPIIPTATLEGEMALNGVRMTASGFLKEVLSQIKLDQRDLLVLPDQNVGFTVRDGVLHQQPLTMLISGQTMKLSGSVGLDDLRLDMLAEVPITRELLGNRADLYELLKGETIKVPISGTASRPTVSRDALMKSLAPLIESAAKKLLQQKGGSILEGLINKGKHK